MLAKVTCPECGDTNYATDPICLSCGADLRQPVEHPAEATGRRSAAEVSPADWEIAVPSGERAERLRRAQELELQVESLIEQGYHLLPKEPDARYGPADDISDLCREIGECHLKNGSREDAVRWFERALVIAPGNVFARAYLVGALCDLGRHEEARVWYEETPGDPIDKNVVRAWLRLPDERAKPQHRRPTWAAATQRPIPSADRTLTATPKAS